MPVLHSNQTTLPSVRTHGPPPRMDSRSSRANGDKDDVFSYFQRGREFEGIHDNHVYSQAELDKMQGIDSIDYLPQNSYAYRTWLRGEGHPSRICEWAMYGLVGCSVGITGYFVKNLVKVLTDVRIKAIEAQLEADSVGMAWVVAAGISVAYVLASTCVVIFVGPDAAGSGLPEVIAYLNGAHIRRIFSLRTGIVKFVSVIFAVSSGLPVGPEGPMVHLGAILGKGISQGRVQGIDDSKKLSRTWCSQFQTSEQRRNFLSAGAAAGIAAAFGAPVGGTLFAMEEVASYWNTTLTWQIFFCCMCSTFTINLFNTAFPAFVVGADFGLFASQEGILFEVEKKMPVNLFMAPASVIIGVTAGLFATVFTFFNLKVARWRQKFIQPRKWRRILEVVVIALAMATVAILVPNFTECTTTCSQKECLTKRRTPYRVEPQLPKFTCEYTEHGSRQLEAEYAGNRTSVTYNEAATLLWVPGEEAVEHLFSRETPNEFRYQSLFLLLLFYFPLSVYTAGSAVSSGIVVPILMTGACIGRIFGQIFWDLFVQNESLPENLIDPGAFALVGAAAFFGGVSRLTVSLTVIMMEITNDGTYLLPIMISCISAKWVADFMTHSLYHSLIEAKALPFLDSGPVYRKNLDLFPVKDIMVSPVVCLSAVPGVEEIVNTLMSNTHSAYPLVENHVHDGSITGCLYRGTVSRLHLISILEHLQETGMTSASKARITPRGSLLDIQSNESSAPGGKYIHYNVLEKLHQNNPIYKDGLVLNNFLLEIKNSACAHNTLDLRPYCNYSAPSVAQELSVHRAFVMFRALGLRHLVVTNKYNHVSGILTRKDFMGFKVEEKLNMTTEERTFEPNPLADVDFGDAKSPRLAHSRVSAGVAALPSMQSNVRNRVVRNNEH